MPFDIPSIASCLSYTRIHVRGLINLNYTFNILFKVNAEAKVITNEVFILQFHYGIHSEIHPTLRNIFQAFYKDEYDRINELSYLMQYCFTCCKLRDTAIELGSKYTFFKTWNSLLNSNGSVNYSLIIWFFSSLKTLRVILKNANHPVIRYGKTVRIISLPNVKTEYFILKITFNFHSSSDCYTNWVKLYQYNPCFGYTVQVLFLLK